MKNINIYIHTWKINNWREILNEQLSQIDDSGLGDIASIHICNSDAEKKTWFEMWKHSFDNDSYYLYLQNLGISWQGTKYEDITTNWRKWWTKSSHLSKLENPFEHQKYSVPEHGGERVIMEGWLTSQGENFKELRNDLSKEPAEAYINQHLKNIPK